MKNAHGVALTLFAMVACEAGKGQLTGLNPARATVALANGDDVVVHPDTITKCVRVALHDNTKTADRYTAVYLDEPEGRPGLYGARGMSEHPCHPQGVGMYTSASPGNHLGKRVMFEELPVDVRNLIVSDCFDEVPA